MDTWEYVIAQFSQDIQKHFTQSFYQFSLDFEIDGCLDIVFQALKSMINKSLGKTQYSFSL